MGEIETTPTILSGTKPQEETLYSKVDELSLFLGKSREPILEGALICLHHQLACKRIEPHKFLIYDHNLWHDYIDLFAGSKPNQTKSRVNRNKSFSSRWFKMPPGRKPKSFVIETYPTRIKDVERKLEIVRSKVGDHNSPKKIKINGNWVIFRAPNQDQLQKILAEKQLTKRDDPRRTSKKRPRESSRVSTSPIACSSPTTGKKGSSLDMDDEFRPNLKPKRPAHKKRRLNKNISTVVGSSPPSSKSCGDGVSARRSVLFKSCAADICFEDDGSIINYQSLNDYSIANGAYLLSTLRSNAISCGKSLRFSSPF